MESTIEKSVLHKLAYLNRLDLIRIFVEKHGYNVDLRDEHGRTPLFYAIARTHEDIVYYLVENGADVNACANDKMTPLHLAVLDRYMREKYIEEGTY